LKGANLDKNSFKTAGVNLRTKQVFQMSNLQLRIL